YVFEYLEPAIVRLDDMTRVAGGRIHVDEARNTHGKHQHDRYGRHEAKLGTDCKIPELSDHGTSDVGSWEQKSQDARSRALRPFEIIIAIYYELVKGTLRGGPPIQSMKQSSSKTNVVYQKQKPPHNYLLRFSFGESILKLSPKDWRALCSLCRTGYGTLARGGL